MLRAIPTRERWILAAILALAFALRVVYVLEMRASPFFDEPQLDQRFYVDWGRALAHGESLYPGVILRAPLYAWWLGGVFAIFGDGLLAPRLVQALVGTCSVALMAVIARRYFGARAALIAALLGASNWVLVYYDGELLRESLGNCVYLVALWLVGDLLERPTWKRCLPAGAALGLAALVRPQVLVFVVLLALWLAWRRRLPLAQLALLACAVFAPIAPVTAYNWFVARDLVLISPEAGQALWLGNHPTADGVTAVAPGMRGDWWGGHDDTRAIAEQEAGRTLRASEVSRHFVHKTIAHAVEHPAAALRLLGRKLVLCLGDWEFGNPEEPRFLARRFAPIVRFLPLGFAATLALAVLGFSAHARRAQQLAPLWGFVLAYGATVVVFLVSARYRLPLVPVLIVFAAAGVVHAVDLARARRWLPFAGSLLLACAVYAWSRAAPAPVEASRANGLAWLGVAEARDGRPRQALEYFDESLAQRADACYAHTWRANTLHALGRDGEALAALERALALCPEDIEALDLAASLELAAGRFAQARELAERSIRAAPHLSRARYLHGRTLIVLGAPEQALASFESALERDPRSFNAAYALAMTALDLHDEARALPALERAVANGDAAPPAFLFNAYEQLIDLLVRRGRRAEAIEHAESLRARLPQNERARQLRQRL